MKVLKIIGIVILILIAIIVVLGLVAPKDYSVERAILIDSPKELVFDQVKYFRNWQAWSPWAEGDSLMTWTVEGIDGTEGSSYIWEGDPKGAGTGEMTNTGIEEYAEIAYHLRFIDPMESESDGYVRISEEEGKTNAVWGFYGKNPFPWNIMTLFKSMDKMVGKDFERGLDLLKGICEKQAESVLSYEILTTKMKAKNYAAIQAEVKFEEMKIFFTESYAVIQEAMAAKRQKMAGAPAGLYYSWDEQQMISDMAAGIPIKGKLETEEIKTIVIESGDAFYIDYYGPYSNLANAHIALDYYFKKNELKMKSPALEEYITDPSTEPDSTKWLTKIYYFAE